MFALLLIGLASIYVCFMIFRAIRNKKQKDRIDNQNNKEDASGYEYEYEYDEYNLSQYKSNDGEDRSAARGFRYGQSIETTTVDIASQDRQQRVALTSLNLTQDKSINEIMPADLEKNKQSGRVLSNEEHKNQQKDEEGELEFNQLDLKTKDALNTDRPEGTQRISLVGMNEYDQQGSSRYTEDVSQYSYEPDLQHSNIVLPTQTAEQLYYGLDQKNIQQQFLPNKNIPQLNLAGLPQNQQTKNSGRYLAPNIDSGKKNSSRKDSKRDNKQKMK